MDDQSIIQLSTPRVTSAIHVIRMSGDECLPFLKRHTGLIEIEPRKVYYRVLFGSDHEDVIDSVLCFFFLAPHSYTGEDMVEIHTHGSLLIVDEILHLAQSEGFRLALSGEFTYRAFLYGKVGLEQAEAIDGLIHSRSDFQKHNAIQILQKKVSFRFLDLKESMLRIQAELESVIEFPEEDIPEIVENKETLYHRYQTRVEEIIAYFEEIYQNYRSGRKLAEGFCFVIIGAPNSGKSTLFNLLLREGRALVSDIKGTTRDYISERYSLPNVSGNANSSIEAVLYDTAGIHEDPEVIEAMGIQKLPELTANADLVIWLMSGLDCYREFTQSKTGKKILASIEEKYPHDISEHLWIVLNKMDVISREEEEKLEATLARDFPKLKSTTSTSSIQTRLSLLTNPNGSREKVEMLFQKWISTHFSVNYESPALLNQRQGNLAQQILTELFGIRDKIERMEEEEIVAEEFRRLNRYLKELSLETGPEEVYDLLFSRFCIGK